MELFYFVTVSPYDLEFVLAPLYRINLLRSAVVNSWERDWGLAHTSSTVTHGIHCEFSQSPVAKFEKNT